MEYLRVKRRVTGKSKGENAEGAEKKDGEVRKKERGGAAGSVAGWKRKFWRRDAAEGAKEETGGGRKRMFWRKDAAGGNDKFNKLIFGKLLPIILEFFCILFLKMVIFS